MMKINSTPIRYFFQIVLITSLLTGLAFGMDGNKTNPLAPGNIQFFFILLLAVAIIFTSVKGLIYISGRRLPKR